MFARTGRGSRFTGPNCSYCESAEALLTEHGVTFIERRVDDPDELDELRRRAPRAMALSQIFLGGEHIGNDDDRRIRQAARRVPFDSDDVSPSPAAG